MEGKKSKIILEEISVSNSKFFSCKTGIPVLRNNEVLSEPRKDELGPVDRASLGRIEIGECVSSKKNTLIPNMKFILISVQ